MPVHWWLNFRFNRYFCVWAVVVAFLFAALTLYNRTIAKSPLQPKRLYVVWWQHACKLIKPNSTRQCGWRREVSEKRDAHQIPRSAVFFGFDSLKRIDTVSLCVFGVLFLLAQSIRSPISIRYCCWPVKKLASERGEIIFHREWNCCWWAQCNFKSISTNFTATISIRRNVNRDVCSAVEITMKPVRVATIEVAVAAVPTQQQ